MGSAASKARKLPVTPKSKPTWAGARTELSAETSKAGNGNAKASEVRNAAIEQDGADPHLLMNLRHLGPVSVDHHMQTIRPNLHMKRMLDTRQASEKQASARTTRNRVTADVLAYLLERRTMPTTEQSIKDLAEQYGMDATTLEDVAKHVNHPTVAEGSVVRVVGKDGEERVTMKAEWVEPA